MLDIAELPMSSAIAALPRTRSGMPVPYTTLYRDEQEPTYLDRQDGQQILACRCQFGQGRPQFGKPCPKRQRNCMLYRRCVVCGRRLAPTTQAVFLGLAKRTANGAVDPQYVSIEPPAHADSAAYSALACPHLAGGADKVIVGVTRTYEVWQMVTTPPAGTEDTSPLLVPPHTKTVLGAVELYTAIIDPAKADVMPQNEWFATPRTETVAPIYASRS
jgi:hypothetical protein